MRKEQLEELKVLMAGMSYWDRLTIETAIDQGVMTKRQALRELQAGKWQH
jgi:hypothetical protein